MSSTTRPQLGARNAIFDGEKTLSLEIGRNRCEQLVVDAIAPAVALEAIEKRMGLPSFAA